MSNAVFSSYLHRLFFILAPSFLHTCTVFSSYLRSAQDNIFHLLSITSNVVFFLYNLSYKLFTNILTNKRKHRLFFIERYCVKTLLLSCGSRPRLWRVHFSLDAPSSIPCSMGCNRSCTPLAQRQ